MVAGELVCRIPDPEAEPTLPATSPSGSALLGTDPIGSLLNPGDWVELSDDATVLVLPAIRRCWSWNRVDHHELDVV